MFVNETALQAIRSHVLLLGPLEFHLQGLLPSLVLPQVPSSALSSDPQREKREKWRLRFSEVHFHRSALLSKSLLPAFCPSTNPCPGRECLLLCSSTSGLWTAPPRAPFYLYNTQNLLEPGKNDTKLIKHSPKASLIYPRTDRAEGALLFCQD